MVTRDAYLALYPDDEIHTRYVVINGCRRLAAAHDEVRTEALDISVNDDVARDRVTLISAAIAENVDQQDFDVIRRSQGRSGACRGCGRANLAAERLRKTKGWVSQRLALLQLAPELQSALRRGDLAIREARSLARVPHELQVRRWQAALEREQNKESHQPRDRRPSPSRALTVALNRFNTEPRLLVTALREQLGSQASRRWASC